MVILSTALEIMGYMYLQKRFLIQTFEFLILHLFNTAIIVIKLTQYELLFILLFLTLVVDLRQNEKKKGTGSESRLCL